MKLLLRNTALLLLTLFTGLVGGASAQTAPAKPAAAPALAATPALAAPSSPDPKKLPYIEEIFRATKPESVVSNLLNQYKGAFQQAATQGFEQEVKKFDDPAKYRGDFTKLQDRVFALLNSRLDWQKLKPYYVQVYSDTFTVDELSGMATFYKSAAGKAFLDKSPVVFQKWQQTSQQQVGTAGPEIQKMMTDFMADVKKRSASAPKPPAK